MLNLSTSEHTNQQLISERYDRDAFESTYSCLIRAHGIAKFIGDMASNVSHYDSTATINPSSLEHTIKALEMEITDATLILEDIQRQSREFDKEQQEIKIKTSDHPI